MSVVFKIVMSIIFNYDYYNCIILGFLFIKMLHLIYKSAKSISEKSINYWK